MYKHVAEAFVAVVHAPSVAEKICTRVKDFCRSIVTAGPDWLLDFDDGRAIIRAVDEGLFLRVSARDLVVFYGIRTILEGSLLRYIPSCERAIEWLAADGTPFRAISRLVRDDRPGCPAS